mgnify:CR=1 FL=1
MPTTTPLPSNPSPSPTGEVNQASAPDRKNAKELLLDHRLTPMQAAGALYAGENDEVANAIIDSLSQQIFESE